MFVFIIVYVYILFTYRALEEVRNTKALIGGQHVEQTEDMLEQHKHQNNQGSSTQFSYNKKALQMACEGLASSQLPFLETLCVASFPVSEHDDNDDLEREVSLSTIIIISVIIIIISTIILIYIPFKLTRMHQMAFYNQSLLAVQEGRRKLTELGVPTRRPADFFCEHAKSDTHMGRVSVMTTTTTTHYIVLCYVLSYCFVILFRIYFLL